MGQKVTLSTVSGPLPEQSSLHNGHLGLVGLVTVSFTIHIVLNPVLPGSDSALAVDQQCSTDENR